MQEEATSKAAPQTSDKEASASDRMEVDTEEDSSKASAQKAKEQGNAAYKARKFEDAIKHYDEAISLDDTDISFLTNRLAFCPFITRSFEHLATLLKGMRTV